MFMQFEELRSFSTIIIVIKMMKFLVCTRTVMKIDITYSHGYKVKYQNKLVSSCVAVHVSSHGCASLLAC